MDFKKSIFFLFSLIIIFNIFVSLGMADPNNPPSPPPPPPPPPIVDYYFYSLMDEFKGCGGSSTGGNSATWCENYYNVQHQRIQAGVVLASDSSSVCTKPAACTEQTWCSNSPSSNTYFTKTLSQNWVCPNGFGLAKRHSPGVLNSGFSSISYDNFNELRDNTSVNFFFDAYVPACVNRIPMMRLDVKLLDSNGIIKNKVGLYAKHETLTYSGSLNSGGGLKNFEFPEQSEFRKDYNLSVNLKSYRMWAYRQRFVEGLNRMVSINNLVLPAGINIPNQIGEYDTPEIYFSEDFMNGNSQVSNNAGNPVGSSVNINRDNTCKILATDLGLGSAVDISNEISNNKVALINNLNSLPATAKTSCSKNIVDIVYNSPISTTGFNDLIVSHNGISLSDLGFNDFNSIKNGYTTSSKTNPIDIKIQNTLGGNNNIWINKISNVVGNTINIGPYTFDSNSIPTIDDQFVKSKFPNYQFISSSSSINSVNTSKSDISILVYSDKINLDSTNWVKNSVSIWADTTITYSTTVSTATSWSWRSLKSLTLTNLAKCLYNWDNCLKVQKFQSGVPSAMYEVASLGYGPVLNSVAWKWSSGNLLANEGLVFDSSFDGSLGDITLPNIPLTVYKKCEVGDSWISSEKYYACYNSTIYKCGLGLSNVEQNLNFLINFANYGDTIKTVGVGNGMACINSLNGPKWQNISCYN